MKNKANFSLKNQTGKTVVTHVKLANTFLSRFKGLMLSKALGKNEAVLISPCKQIHTHFMRYSIDVIFLDSSFNVIEIIENMQPWKLSKHIKNSHYVLELSANTAHKKISIADRLILTTSK